MESCGRLAHGARFGGPFGPRHLAPPFCREISPSPAAVRGPDPGNLLPCFVRGMSSSRLSRNGSTRPSGSLAGFCQTRYPWFGYPLASAPTAHQHPDSAQNLKAHNPAKRNEKCSTGWTLLGSGERCPPRTAAKLFIKRDVLRCARSRLTSCSRCGSPRVPDPNPHRCRRHGRGRIPR